MSIWIANTFSICARDAETGQLAVATASRCISVGAWVPFAKPGVGAIASQSQVSARYGEHGLELLAAGMEPQAALEQLISEDVQILEPHDPRIEEHVRNEVNEEGIDYRVDPATGRRTYFTHRFRQVGMVDAQGRAAIHHGARCCPAVSGVIGDGYCCLGNTLSSEHLASAMAEAYEQARTRGDNFLRSLLAALQAGEAAGGDSRGKQAASLLIVRDTPNWAGTHRWCDVRVDDDPDPIPKLVASALKFEY